MNKINKKKALKQREKANSSKLNSSKRTITLNSTDETDIIECSIVGFENKYSSLKTSCNVIKESKDCKTKSEFSCKSKGVNDSLRESFRKSFGLVDNEDLNQNLDDFGIKTPQAVSANAKHCLVMSKILSSLKKTPGGPYLSRSKLQNIQQWLNDNNVEYVSTPPFANLSVTPIKTQKSEIEGNSIKKLFSHERNKNEKKGQDSSIDSEVEEVLKAVYGGDWMERNVIRQCKTEPKKKQTKFLTATEAKKKKLGSAVCSARRNILGSKKLDFLNLTNSDCTDLNSSVVSGIDVINLDNSKCCDEFIKKPKRVVRKGKGFRDETSSLESLNCVSTKGSNGKKLTADPKNKTSKNSAVKSRIQSQTPKKTFLASLSVSTPNSRCHPDAQFYKVNFKSKKDQLIKKLFKLYNTEIFNGKLADDMNFSWNVKLRGTAGYCYNKRITKSTGEIIRLSRIEFSTKIVDRADRLRDTMIHELCHAASWVINGTLDGHGAVWTEWASKAALRFPELPPIKRCHNYEVVSKYIYRCTGCGYSIKRHSKSINTEKKRCGHCYGTLELLLNKKKKGKGEVPEYDTTKTLRTPNKFALFVKENYHSVKSTKTQAKHAEIMKILSEQYASVKNGVKSKKKSHRGNEQELFKKLIL